jgi:hypothetical protein
MTQAASDHDLAPSGELDVDFYGDWYPDMAALDAKGRARHWRKFGAAEGRHPSLRALLESMGQTLAEIPEDFDAAEYARLNPDLAGAGILTPPQLLVHYLSSGRRENRPYRAAAPGGNAAVLDVRFYGTYYQDLAGLDDDALRMHWQQFGAREERYPSHQAMVAASRDAEPDDEYKARLRGGAGRRFARHAQAFDWRFTSPTTTTCRA